MKMIGNERPVPNHFMVPWHGSARSWSPAVAGVSGESLHVTALANVLPLTTSIRIIKARQVNDSLANRSPIYSFCFSRLRSLFWPKRPAHRAAQRERLEGLSPKSELDPPVRGHQLGRNPHLDNYRHDHQFPCCPVSYRA